MVIVKNFYPLESDPRLLKLLSIFQSGNYRTTFLGWDRSSSTSSSSNQLTNEGYREKIMQRKASSGLGGLFLLPFWWLFELACLLKLDYDIIHVVNFPSIIPAFLAAKLKKKLIVYDIEDTYIDQLPILPTFLRSLGIHIERFCTTIVNAVVLVDEVQVAEFGGIPNHNIAVVYDSPSSIFDSFDQFENRDNFLIFYAGYLSQGRHLNLDSLLSAVEGIQNVKVIFAGEGDLVEHLKTKARETPDKIQYAGRIPYKKVLELSSQADLLFSLRDPVPLVQKYICGSKFLEAIMCAKPIIVNKGTSAALKVAKHRCGIVVDARNVDEIRNAIILLKEEPSLCKELGTNGRVAYENIYGWEKMRQRLLHLYSELIQA